MRKLFYGALAMAAVMAVASCKEKKTSLLTTDTSNMDSLTVADSTIYGRIGENFGMSTLELITDKGDTMTFVIDDPDDSLDVDPVKGGKGVGDRMAVVARRNADGDDVVVTAVNLTTLLGKWSALDKTFEIQEGGTVVSNFTEPKPYTDWRISNGLLILSADTFAVYELGADSLLLENDKGIFSYKRQE